MAVSRYEYAMLSNAVYHDGNYIDPANEGFEKIFEKEYPQCGFYAAAYKRGADIVVVFRGSDNRLNYFHDLRWSMGGRPPEFEAANDFMKMVEDKNVGYTITMTGHSLGGGAVQYVGAVRAKKGQELVGVTFGAGGAGGLSELAGVDPGSVRVTNCTHEGDTVPETLSRHFGDRIITRSVERNFALVQNSDGVGEIVGFPKEAGGDHRMFGYMVDAGVCAGKLQYRDPYVQELQSGRHWYDVDALTLNSDAAEKNRILAKKPLLNENSSDRVDFMAAIAEKMRENQQSYEESQSRQAVNQQISSPKLPLAAGGIRLA